MDKKQLALCYFALAGLLLLLSNALNYNHKIIYISSGILALWGVLILLGNYVRLAREAEIKSELFTITARQAAIKSKEEHEKRTLEYNIEEKKRIYESINNAARSGYFQIGIYQMPHEALKVELIQKGFIIEPYVQNEFIVEPDNYIIKWQ